MKSPVVLAALLLFGTLDITSACPLGFWRIGKLRAIRSRNVWRRANIECYNYRYESFTNDEDGDVVFLDTNVEVRNGVPNMAVPTFDEIFDEFIERCFPDDCRNADAAQFCFAEYGRLGERWPRVIYFDQEGLLVSGNETLYVVNDVEVIDCPV